MLAGTVVRDQRLDVSSAQAGIKEAGPLLGTQFKCFQAEPLNTLPLFTHGGAKVDRFLAAGGNRRAWPSSEFEKQSTRQEMDGFIGLAVEPGICPHPLHPDSQKYYPKA